MKQHSQHCKCNKNWKQYKKCQCGGSCDCRKRNACRCGKQSCHCQHQPCTEQPEEFNETAMAPSDYPAGSELLLESEEGLTVSIAAGEDLAHSLVSAYGSTTHVVTDLEAGSFKVDNANLKRAFGIHHAGMYGGKEPSEVELKGKQHKSYKEPDVSTYLKVLKSEILGISSDPVIVAKKTFTNNSSKTATFDASISDQVANTTSNTWSNSNTIQVGQSISYGISFLGSGGGGETSFSYSHTWGQSKTESQMVTVGSSSGFSIVLDPGESVQAQLVASRGTMKVRVTYEANLYGRAYARYHWNIFKPDQVWISPIGGVMNSGGLPNSIIITEDIEVGYYSNATVEIHDTAGQLLLTAPGSFVE